MSNSEILLQVAIYAIPSFVFFGAVYYFTNKWVEMQREKNKVLLATGQKTGKVTSDSSGLKKHVFPLQVEAYQRLVLFLERIAPNNMIMRLNNPGLPARGFQQKLLENVRQEFEHNLAQQIFVSPASWKMVQASKEEVLKIINMAATKLEPTALANDLGKSIFEITAQLAVQPTEQAIEQLKAELNQIIKEA